MGATRIWDARNNRHATVEHETLRPCPFCGGTPRIDDDVDDTTERYTVRCDCGGNMPGRHVPIDPSFQTRVTCLHSAVEKSTTAMTSIAACPCPVVPVNGCNRSPTFN